MTSFRPHKFKMIDEAGREITRLAASGLLATLVPLVNDLASDMPDGERYRRLLQAVRRLLPCDAAALLQPDAGYLVPLAVNGLSTDTLGRRFKIDEHPRHCWTGQVPRAFPATVLFPTLTTAWWTDGSKGTSSTCTSMTVWVARCKYRGGSGA